MGGSDRRPPVTVVVVTYNEGCNLRPTVDSLCLGLPAGGEVIVVDDGSTDGSTAFLDDGPPAGVRGIRTAGRIGIAPARNLGAAAARGEVLVFSDAHVQARPGWLEPLVEALSDPAVGAVAPVISWMGRQHLKGYGFTWNDPSLVMRWLPHPDGQIGPWPVPFLCGCFVAIRQEVWAATGGFDEGMRRWGLEDAELSLRLWLEGWECRVVLDSEVAHLFRDRFPYPVDSSDVLHNTLRLATLHLSSRAIERILVTHRDAVVLPDAVQQLLSGDAGSRRAELAERRRCDPDELLARLGIECLL